MLSIADTFHFRGMPGIEITRLSASLCAMRQALASAISSRFLCRSAFALLTPLANVCPAANDAVTRAEISPACWRASFAARAGNVLFSSPHAVPPARKTAANAIPLFFACAPNCSMAVSSNPCSVGWPIAFTCTEVSTATAAVAFSLSAARVRPACPAAKFPSACSAYLRCESHASTAPVSGQRGVAHHIRLDGIRAARSPPPLPNQFVFC